MSMMVCPAIPNMTCVQGCCCAICEDAKRDYCNSVCGFWKKGQIKVRENLTNKAIELAGKFELPTPRLESLTLEQLANYVQSLKMYDA